MQSKGLLVAAAQRRLVEARRALWILRGRAVAGDPDDREQERVALLDMNRARAELAALEADGGESLRRTERVTA